jgi:hypothetical protein
LHKVWQRQARRLLCLQDATTVTRQRQLPHAVLQGCGATGPCCPCCPSPPGWPACPAAACAPRATSFAPNAPPLLWRRSADSGCGAGRQTGSVTGLEFGLCVGVVLKSVALQLSPSSNQTE